MASALETLIDYAKGCISFFSKADDTADGNTDENAEKGQSQVDQQNAKTTEAKEIANVAFSNHSLAAEKMVASEMYDVTQANTRINKLYNFTRKNFYDQGARETPANQNYVMYKASIASDVMKLCDEIREMVTYK